MKTFVQKLSVCVCGFSALDKSIPLGAEYEVNLCRIENVLWFCAGCGRSTCLLAIWAEPRGQEHGQLLPKELFAL